MEWQYIEEYLERAKIPNGWLVRQSSYIKNDQDFYWINSICFVPDEGHYWQIINKDGE